MKPTRGLTGSWFQQIPRERRLALLSLAVLFAMFGSILAYQQIMTGGQSPALPQETPAVQPQAGTAHEPAGGPAAQSSVLPSVEQSNAVAVALPLAPPLSGTFKVLKVFGDVQDGYGDMRMYGGIAYGAAKGTPVTPVAPGVVTEATENVLEGGVVSIDHGNGLVSRYSGLDGIQVRLHAKVEAGQTIGQVGETGWAESKLGPHVKLQMRQNRELVDPATYFPN